MIGVGECDRMQKALLLACAANCIVGTKMGFMEVEGKGTR